MNKQMIMEKTNNNEEGGLPTHPSSYSQKMLTDINAYRPAQPVECNKYYYCKRCVERHAKHRGISPQDCKLPPSYIEALGFSIPDDRMAKILSSDKLKFNYMPVPGVVRGEYQVCDNCFGYLLLTGTVPGRKAVDAAINNMLSPRHHNATFGHFQCHPPYAEHLRHVRQQVMDWTCKEVNGTCYIFSEPGPYGPGNGCGKTFLAAASLSYRLRRDPWFLTNVPDFYQVGFNGMFISVEDLVADFWKRKSLLGPNSKPLYHVDGDELTFDMYREHVADHRNLVLDDVGCRVANTMVQETYEVIFDRRCQKGWFTCVTSNFSLENLGSRIGGRAVSRLVSDEPFIKVKVEAPDFSLVRKCKSL